MNNPNYKSNAYAEAAKHTMIITHIADATLTELTESLQAVQAANPQLKALKSHEAAKKALTKLNQFTCNYDFSNQTEEINFFKHKKPRVWAQLIYQTELYLLEQNKPLTGKKKIAQYLKEQLNLYNQFLERHKALYNYYRLEQTHLDHLFFTKEADNGIHPPEPITDSDIDLYLGSIYSYRFAKFQALERLIENIRFEMDCLNQQGLEKTKNSSLIWTSHKVHLIELAYALQAVGSINQGHTDVKTIIQGLEGLFQIQLGNYYGVFNQNIRTRTKNRTEYLDQLKTAVIKRMDDSDENPRTR